MRGLDDLDAGGDKVEIHTAEAAARVVAKPPPWPQRAADLLEASPADLLVEGGRVFVQGTPSIAVTLPEVAGEAMRRGPEVPGGGAMLVNGQWDGGDGGWAQSTHVCWVEIDLETGQVAIDRYLVVEDCGELINPAIVDGQIRGGVAQGVGAVLYEKSTYDDDGNFQAGTFTTSACGEPSAVYSVEVLLPWLATHHGVVGPALMPQPLTRFASGLMAPAP